MNDATKEPAMRRILIVEDDPSIGKALAIRLRAAGYEATVAHDGSTGVEVAVIAPPSLVILDISLPWSNGFTVAERLKSLLPASTPLIFLTASRKAGLRERAEALGAAAFFCKPYDAVELLGAIRRALAEVPALEQMMSPRSETETKISAEV
jgi:DNA-binding response OmpR family regulator